VNPFLAKKRLQSQKKQIAASQKILRKLMLSLLWGEVLFHCEAMEPPFLVNERFNQDN
jgi:hypothetical protein